MATQNDFSIGDIAAKAGTKARGFITVGETPVGPIRIPIVIVAGARPGPTLCLTAGVHATEYPAIDAVMRTTQSLDPAELGGVVTAYDAALLTLEKAQTLVGCQNRVKLQTARTYLSRARMALAKDPRDVEGARADLETILGFREPTSAQGRTSAWPEMFQRVEDEMKQLSEE